MVKLMKFVYFMIYFLSLFLVASKSFSLTNIDYKTICHFPFILSFRLYLLHNITSPLITTPLFFITATHECHNDLDCGNKIKCVPPRIAVCINYKCYCILENDAVIPWSTQPKQAK